MKLPPNFEAPETVVICGNALFNINSVFSHNGEYLLAFGRTSKKEKIGIWLSTIITSNNKDKHEYLSLVENSTPKNSNIEVLTTEKQILVQWKNQTILKIDRIESDSKVNVTYLDFNPIGIRAKGESDMLEIAGTTFKHLILRLANKNPAFNLGIQ